VGYCGVVSFGAVYFVFFNCLYGFASVLISFVLVQLFEHSYSISCLKHDSF
jgi:hypothetical protein